MSVTTHIAEVIRQGIWASLTGGWYYEPNCSIFCNTVHVYIWLMLMLVPLILGLFVSGSLTIPISVAYTAFIVILFTAIKLAISYLHMIFDTTDPIVVTRTINDSIDDTFRESEHQPLDIEMIELRDMGFNMRGSERALDPDRRDNVSREDRDSTGAPSGRRNPASSVSTSKRVRIDDDSTSRQTAKEVTEEVREEMEEEEDEEKNTKKFLKEYETQQKRKLSEPTIVITEYTLNGASVSINRRMSEPNISENFHDSIIGLEEDNGEIDRKKQQKMSSRMIKTIENEFDDVDDDENTEEEEEEMKKTSVSVMDVPSTSSKRRSSRRRSSTGTTISSSKRRSSRRAGSPAIFAGALVKRDSQESSRSMPSSIGWTPVVVSLGDIDRPTTSRYSADDAESGSDIKVEITKFLEELIDKHPETLDAIESVRLSRLGRIRSLQSTPSEQYAITNVYRPPQAAIRGAGAGGGARRSNSFIDWHPHQQVGTSSSSSQHHIAQGHEDTTQGAVHSFQDEDGNWWTYAFDESGVGTAQPLGSGRAIMELLQREKEKPDKKQYPPQELEVLPESMYDSTDEEEEEEKTKGEGKKELEGEEKQMVMEKETIPLTRRERALSSSSNDSCTYMPTLPSSVFHAPSGTGATRTTSRTGSQIVCFSNAATRFRNALRSDGGQGGSSDDRSHDSMWQMEQIMELIENSHGTRRETATSTNNQQTITGTTSREQRGESLPSVAVSNQQERLFLSHLDSASSSTGPPSRYRFLSDIAFTGLPQQPTAASAGTPDFNCSRRPSNIRKSYYYQMKMFPKAQKSFNLKLDRPSIDRLFDRNRCIWSLLFDIFLAASVAILASLVINADIYFDYSLIFFAVVVASAHFSLLKSVQPDASSPIHGFNWIVAYNRPIYFCILAIILLLLHEISGGTLANEKIAWNWNPFRLALTSSQSIMIAVRDIVATILLFLPLAFTMGWLPQINTLIHHVFEQVEMHLFGGTASFGVFSAFAQISKSLAVYGALCAVCRLAYTFSPTTTQSPFFSAFIAITIALSYILSRMSSNQHLTVVLFDILTSPFRKSGKDMKNESIETTNTTDENSNNQQSRYDDEMPMTVRKTVFQRARYDLLFSIFLILFFFALHSTSVFTATQPYFTRIISAICVLMGIINHYLYPQLRSHTPWRAISQPILRSAEHGQFEHPDAAKLMVFEVIHMWMGAIERNILYPLFVSSLITENNWTIPYPWLLLPLISMRLLRGGFAQPQLMYIPIGFSCLAAAFDLKQMSIIEGKPPLTSWNLLPLIAYVSVAIYPKFVELYLKINFVMAYVAPWQISWGSAFHAFAQPFSVPHSALIAVQTVISSIISAPLNPFLGSSFFTSSYVRPVKFWERDYNTKRTDASNTRLASQIDRGPMMDDSNLNAVFYEHLTRSLQKSLAGDLAMGRWSTSVQPGDCFILASYYLNCLVHIIEVGNGFVTFQLRGLEFRGTYCHQREVEAISEDIRDGTGCCCCSPGSLPGFLSLNTAWGLRWLAWEVVSGKYIIDGYSISDNSAVNLLQVHELRRLLVTLYVKCIIYYITTSNKLAQWMEDDMILSAIQAVNDLPKYTDLDSMFCSTNDEDYDMAEGGISKSSFSDFYSNWVDYCLQKRAESRIDETINRDNTVILCYLLSLVGRRSLGTAAFNRHSNAAESFLYGLHALFKGDFRITCQRDEWVFTDMDLLRCVVAPAVKMALKLHQDHFAHFEEFDDHDSLFTAIGAHLTRMFISHEQDPGWRSAILANTPSLLALRHVYDDGQDDYKIIMLNKMHLNMRVIKLNRECVRAFWAGQQQELIFLRNRNPERGSIQNARQVLRNMINSSADQPVGYPIYVSPLTTSHIESHSQIKSIFGPTFTFDGICLMGRIIWEEIRAHFQPSGMTEEEAAAQAALAAQQQQQQQPARAIFHIGTPNAEENEDGSEEDREVATITLSAAGKQLENSIVEMTKDGVAKVSVIQRQKDNAEPTTVISSIERERMLLSRPNLAHILKSGNVINENREICIGAWLQITDAELIFKCLNEPFKSTGECLVVWPDELIQHISGRSSWLYQPMKGMCGRIVYTWYPNHPLRAKRSHVGDHIHLIAIPAMTNGLVPIAEKGTRLLTMSECALQGYSGTTTVRNDSPYSGIQKKLQEEFLTRFNDALILAKIVPGTVSAKMAFPKKPPIPPPAPTNPQPSQSSEENQPSTSMPPTNQ